MNEIEQKNRAFWQQWAGREPTSAEYQAFFDQYTDIGAKQGDALWKIAVMSSASAAKNNDMFAKHEKFTQEFFTQGQAAATKQIEATALKQRGIIEASLTETVEKVATRASIRKTIIVAIIAFVVGGAVITGINRYNDVRAEHEYNRGYSAGFASAPEWLKIAETQKEWGASSEGKKAKALIDDGFVSQFLIPTYSACINAEIFIAKNNKGEERFACRSKDNTMSWWLPLTFAPPKD